MAITKYKYYPWLLVGSYSLLGVFFPAAVTQFSMVVGDLAAAMSVTGQMILLSDTFRAVCLVLAMFFSGFAYKTLGLRKTMALGIVCQVLPQFLIPFAVSLKSLPLFFCSKGYRGLTLWLFRYTFPRSRFG